MKFLSNRVGIVTVMVCSAFRANRSSLASLRMAVLYLVSFVAAGPSQSELSTFPCILANSLSPPSSNLLYYLWLYLQGGVFTWPDGVSVPFALEERFRRFLGPGSDPAAWEVRACVRACVRMFTCLCVYMSDWMSKRMYLCLWSYIAVLCISHPSSEEEASLFTAYFSKLLLYRWFCWSWQIICGCRESRPRFVQSEREREDRDWEEREVGI